MAIASVHNSIRHQGVPQGRGGHLVLITASFAINGEAHVVFHNPSGQPARNQADAVLTATTFDTFYAERGIVIHQEPPCES